MICNVCQKAFPKNNALIGISITAGGFAIGKRQKESFSKQLFPYKLDKTYRVCWKCWLQSMGIKP